MLRQTSACVADGEVVWSRPPDAEVKLVLVCSKQQHWRWGQQSPVPKESTKDTVKTDRAGGAGSSGWTCGTCRLRFFTAGRPRASVEVRLSLRLSDVEARDDSMARADHAARSRPHGLSDRMVWLKLDVATVGASCADDNDRRADARSSAATRAVSSGWKVAYVDVGGDAGARAVAPFNAMVRKRRRRTRHKSRARTRCCFLLDRARRCGL